MKCEPLPLLNLPAEEKEIKRLYSLIDIKRLPISSKVFKLVVSVLVLGVSSYICLSYPDSAFNGEAPRSLIGFFAFLFLAGYSGFIISRYVNYFIIRHGAMQWLTRERVFDIVTMDETLELQREIISFNRECGNREYPEGQDTRDVISHLSSIMSRTRAFGRYFTRWGFHDPSLAPNLYAFILSYEALKDHLASRSDPFMSEARELFSKNFVTTVAQ